MTTELLLARGIVAGRVWSDQDRALLRDVELAREDERKAARRRRRTR